MLSTAKDAHCSSEWIAGSVGTNPVIIRKILGQLKKAGLARRSSRKRRCFFPEQPNPDCPVGANIQAVLELIVRRAQNAMEAILADITMHELLSEFAEHINMKK
nr:Rrf2 family transcriptional regulator [Brevibacillus laterosporus]